jgi:hypothetical protein
VDDRRKKESMEMVAPASAACVMLRIWMRLKADSHISAAATPTGMI